MLTPNTVAYALTDIENGAIKIQYLTIAKANSPYSPPAFAGSRVELASHIAGSS